MPNVTIQPSTVIGDPMSSTHPVPPLDMTWVERRQAWTIANSTSQPKATATVTRFKSQHKPKKIRHGTRGISQTQSNPSPVTLVNPTHSDSPADPHLIAATHGMSTDPVTIPDTLLVGIAAMASCICVSVGKMSSLIPELREAGIIHYRHRSGIYHTLITCAFANDLRWWLGEKGRRREAI
jgi:hypothetical protein